MYRRAFAVYIKLRVFGVTVWKCCTIIIKEEVVLINEIDIKSPVMVDDIHTSLDITQGAPLPKVKRLETFDEDTWEDITLELVHNWKTQYQKVVRCGGGGDLGRDVISYTQNKAWENFQCKYYAKPLTLDEAIREVGKIIYYSYKGKYPVPIKYYFVSPKGVTTQLLNHLMDSEKLKDELIKRWDKQCRTKITAKHKIELDADLILYINSSIDFKIFDHIPPLDIIELHSQTTYHAIRFGASTRKRPKAIIPPSTLEASELTYTSELLLAFGDAEGKDVNNVNLPTFPEYEQEYHSARRNYYWADGLEEFSKDWLPIVCYKELLDECYETISPVIKSDHKNGYERYLKVSAQAAVTNYSSHPLHHYIKVQDKKGLCHHLVNEEKVRWVKY
tara:strand:+ start:482 stop:1651 length:1170 start_codon:yes stop_codon:yes gene_type:complete